MIILNKEFEVSKVYCVFKFKLKKVLLDGVGKIMSVYWF